MASSTFGLGRYVSLLLVLPLLVIASGGCPLVSPPTDNTNDNTNNNTNNNTNDNTNGNDNGDGTRPLPPEEQLDVTVIGNGQVTQVGINGFIRLTATPSTGWRFESWSGSVVSRGNPLIVQPVEGIQLTVTFEVDPLTNDQDGDSLPDAQDRCPNSPPGAAVDDNGCAANERDTDDDGVTDNLDQCPATPMGASVNSVGCAAIERDTDLDGVVDAEDLCPDTQPSAPDVDDNGCSDDQRDTDDDGVVDADDECENTPAGTLVDATGCPECGNGDVNGEEECDPPQSLVCDAACKLIRPPNNNCTSAVALLDDAPRVFTNLRATTDGPAETGACQPIGADIWYCYTASCTGFAEITLDCGAAFDVILATYNNCSICPPNPNTRVLCYDDPQQCGQNNHDTVVEFAVTIGESYLIRLGGWNSVQGGGEITVTCRVPQCIANIDCNDGDFCNGIETCNVRGECVAGTPPCPDLEHCDDINDVCLTCVGDGECADGDLCTTDACVNNECENPPVECGDDICDPASGNCVECLTNAHCDDSLFCNGAETCNLTTKVCEAGVSPCTEGQTCNEDTDACQDDDDGDGVPNSADQCPDTPTGALVDANGCPIDTDNDGVFDGLDNCTTIENPNQDDADSDDVGDLCDNCPDDVNPQQENNDGDDLGNVCDNCPEDANNDQADGDSDMIGNVCDNCPDDPNTDQTDSDGDTFGDACDDCAIDADCDDGIECTVDVCNVTVCASTPSDALCLDDLFCNGEEHCNPAKGDPVTGCLPGADPCDDLIDCTDASCTEDGGGQGTCNFAANDELCPDDGLFCNGAEFCDPFSGCSSEGDPCTGGTSCNEGTDSCEAAPAAWSSTQKLLPLRPGFLAPETYEINASGQLTTAHVNISEQSIEAAFSTDATIHALNTAVPLGVDTLIYDLTYGSGKEETMLTLSMQINSFTLAINGPTATWTFNYTIRDTNTSIFGILATVVKYNGSQTGNVLDGGSRIDWSSVTGTVQTCDENGENCSPQGISTEFQTLGEWTVE